jgi:hypothetical protein
VADLVASSPRRTVSPRRVAWLAAGRGLDRRERVPDVVERGIKPFSAFPAVVSASNPVGLAAKFRVKPLVVADRLDRVGQSSARRRQLAAALRVVTFST